MGSGTSIGGSGSGGGSGAATLDHDTARKIGKARKWLLAISILTFVTGLILFAIQRSEVEKQIREAETQIANIDPATRDAIFKEKIGMTWDQAVKHDRGQVKLLLGIYIALAAIYLGLFFWARRNALAATVTALILFITVHAISAVLDPKTLYQGIIIKILFVAALSTAISAAQRERKLAA
jgi:Na+/melibiose symporter-like transporter